MFNLESSITAWRSQMLAVGIHSPVPLDELESHLRDEIQHHLESGLDAPTAFETAIQKIGKPTVLKKEFSKVPGTPASRLTVIVLLPFIISLFSAIMAALLIFKIGNFSAVNSPQKLSGLAAAAIMALFGWGGLFAQRLFPVISNQRARNAICLGGGVVLIFWWLAFFFLILPRAELTIGGLCVAILWGFAMPFGIYAGLTSGFEKSATRKTRQPTAAP
jgi:hypothetical protein